MGLCQDKTTTPRRDGQGAASSGGGDLRQRNDVQRTVMYKRRMGDVLSFTEAKEERDRVLSELQRVHGRVKEHLATHGRVSRDLVTSFSDVAYMFPFWIRHEYPSHGALTLIGVLEWHLDQIIAAAS